MGLQAILDAIRASGEAQVREIEARAQTQAQAILEEAHTEAQRLSQEVCARVAIQASRERTRLIQQARLEAMQLVGSVREALVDTVLHETREQIACVRTSAGYPAILRALIEEAADSLKPSLRDAERPHLVIDPRDRALLEVIRHDMRLDYPVRYDLNCQGGVVASSEDGRVVVINTVESRFQRATPYLRRYLAALLETAETETVPSPGKKIVNSENVRL